MCQTQVPRIIESDLGVVYNPVKGITVFVHHDDVVKCYKTGCCLRVLVTAKLMRAVIITNDEDLDIYGKEN